MAITDLGVFIRERGTRGLILIELAPGVTLDEIGARTEAGFVSRL
jgi:acyl CoA:acetate/3-ketoacid CoA transferase beta subunit